MLTLYYLKQYAVVSVVLFVLSKEYY